MLAALRHQKVCDIPPSTWKGKLFKQIHSKCSTRECIGRMVLWSQGRVGDAGQGDQEILSRERHEDLPGVQQALSMEHTWTCSYAFSWGRSQSSY